MSATRRRAPCRAYSTRPASAAPGEVFSSPRTRVAATASLRPSRGEEIGTTGMSRVMTEPSEDSQAPYSFFPAAKPPPIRPLPPVLDQPRPLHFPICNICSARPLCCAISHFIFQGRHGLPMWPTQRSSRQDAPRSHKPGTPQFAVPVLKRETCAERLKSPICM